MNKKVFKLFIALFLVFFFTNTVNAALICNPENADTTITETGITDAGFDVALPVCKWIRTSKFKPESGTYDNYQAAFDSGYEKEMIQVESLDAKGLVNKEVSKCSDPDRYVSAKVTCTATSNPTATTYPNTCGEKNETNCKGKCSWDAERGECSGDNSYTTYSCPNGYEPTTGVTSSTQCTKTKVYEFDKPSATDNIVSQAETDFATRGATCEAEYILNCPVYKCERTYKNVHACTPDFQVDGQPAYCVNAGQQFNSGVGNYQLDSDFNVFDCANSYSTVDCGYANILIEGAYYNTSDDAINSALRLWSVHSGQAGYNKTGIANVTGANCDNITYFTTDSDGEYVNVYKQTHDYIMYVAKEKFYDVARTYEHIPTEQSANSRSSLNGNTFEKIACLTTSELNNSARIKQMRGVMCGDDSDYRVAFELYFNTLIGNEYMKAHLSKLYGGGDGAKPTAATLQSEYSLEVSTEESSKEAWVEIQYEYEDFWNEIKGTEVGCSDAKLKELRKKLVKEGKKVEEADAIIENISKYCNVRVEIVDEDGNVLVNEQEMEKCTKGRGCQTRKFRFAICDLEENISNRIKIEVSYERTKSSYSVRKYYSCANANVNQTLFAFFKDENSDEFGGENGQKTGENRTTTSFAVTNYICDGGCNDPSIKKSGTDKCINDQNNYNGVFSAEVKDPSLKCIVNLTDASAKNRFDYSSYFGVNTNFCRVYCSDKVEYTIADKVKAISGKTFMYDIEFPAKKTNKLDYKLTSIVEEKRDCVSEIYFNRLPNIDVFKNAYGLTNEEFAELKKTKTFSGLFNVLKAKASGENERNENLNQIIYDIYNCNMYSKEQILAAGVELPRNYKTTLIKKVKDIYGQNNAYGLGTDRDGKKTTNTSTDKVKYDFGAVIKEATSANNRINIIDTSSTFTGKLSGISYCKNKSGELCYGYDPNNEDANYIYPTNRPGAMRTYNLFRGKNIEVPTNDYARFTVTAEINYYNRDKFQADMGTGKVVRGTSDSSLLTLSSYAYPIDKEAYNLETCKTSIAGGLYHRCPITQTVNPMMFFRNDTAAKLTYNDDNIFRCYVDVEKPNCEDPSKTNCGEKSAALYRNVDPSNIFPSGNIKEDSNWNTEYGQRAKQEIEESASGLKTDEQYLDASITLSPTQIKNIKEYNDNNGGYNNELIYNCDKDPVDGIYYNCNSYFLDVLRGNAAEYSSGTYGNINKDNLR